MRRFLPHVLVVAALGVVVLVLAHCGGGSGPSGPALTAIDNAARGTQAASSGLQSMGVGLDTIDLLEELGGVGDTYAPPPTAPLVSVRSSRPGIPGNPALAKATVLARKLRGIASVRNVLSAARRPVGPRMSVTISDNVYGSVGGYAAWTYTYDNVDDSFSADLDFHAFRDNTSSFVEINGTWHESGHTSLTSGDVVESIVVTSTVSAGTSEGAPLTIKDFNDAELTVLGSRLSGFLTLNQSVTFSTYFDVPKLVIGYSYGVPAGTIRLDYPASDNYAMTYNNFRGELSVEMDSFDNTARAGFAFNGAFGQSRTGISPSSLSLSYSGLRFGTFYHDTNLTDTTIDGVFAISLTPALVCLNGTYNGGTYSFATQVPIRMDDSPGVGHTTQGQFTINGNTVVRYNDDGSVTITVNDRDPSEFGSQDEFADYCIL